MEETPCVCFGVDSQETSDKIKAREWVCSDHWAVLCEEGIVSQNKSPTRAAKITQLCTTPKHVSLQLGCHTRKGNLHSHRLVHEMLTDTWTSKCAFSEKQLPNVLEQDAEV